MENRIVSIDIRTVEKILNELKEIQNLTPENAIKYRVNNLIETISSIANYTENESIEKMIYTKMKESSSRNPELNVKLYMLYRNLTDGKITKEEAIEAYQNYLQMYPYDTLIY